MPVQDKFGSPSTRRALSGPFQSAKSLRVSRFTRWVLVAAACIALLLSAHSSTSTLNILNRSNANRDCVTYSAGTSFVDRNAGEMSPASTHIDLRAGLPETRILAHVPGFTVMDNLYVRNETMFIVTDHPDQLPPLALINKGAPDEGWNYDADPSFIQTLTTAEARLLFGHKAAHMDGASLLWKDFYINHYAHFCLESLLGSWKIYHAAVNPSGTDVVPFPKRFLFMLSDHYSWRDPPGMNSFVIKGAFPAMAISYKSDWEERGALGYTDFYDRVILLDRSAAHHYSPENKVANKVIGAVKKLPTGPNFWQPVRNSLLESLPAPRDAPATQPVITYVSRQGVLGRKIIPSDNDELVRALRQLETSGRAEVHIAEFEKLDKNEQIHLASRTNILIGLHGNGLTHLLWLPPNSVLIELQYPGGWSCDFFYPASTVGHRYYSIRNDTIVRGESMPPAMVIPEGFHGNSIPLRAAAVLRVVNDVLDGREPPPHNTTILG